MKVLKIISAKHIKEYTLEVLFDDGKSVTVDFGEFLRKSKNPQIGKYLKIENFKKFNIDNGDLEWNDYDLCFPIYDIYTNNILHKDSYAEVA